MIDIRPDFFATFRCLASACTDNCCRGWEIDVDTDTLDYYDFLEGEDGAFVRRGLDGGRLCVEGKACTFLREDGLCELILRLGEDALCEICREHPRFYSEIDGICEAGHGLCCEEAARLWLSDRPVILRQEDDGEPIPPESAIRLTEQQKAIGSLYDSQPLGEIFASLLGGADGRRAIWEELRALYASSEVMDPAFPDRIRVPEPTESGVPWRNLAAYFLYRYWFSWGEDAILFAAANLLVIRAMGGVPAVDAKDFSKEVEYDEDNTERIRCWLSHADRQALAALMADTFR